MYIQELAWQHYQNLPHISRLPLNEQIRLYNLYLMEVAEAKVAYMHHEMANPQSLGGGSLIQQEQSDLPSGCIEFVNNTTDGTDCRFWINTSAPTNYTITWGDGETETGEVNGVDQLELNHTYADSDMEYTVRLCFDNISVVTRLEFNGDD